MSENSSALIRRPYNEISSSLNTMHVAHSNEAMWRNGAAACNTYSKNQEYSRVPRRCDYRTLRPNEKPALCADHFTKIDSFGRGNQHPLMHMMDSGNSDGGLSPASYESDTAGGMELSEWSEDGHVRPLEPMTQNGGPKTTSSGKVRPDLPLYRPPPVRGSQQEAISGLRKTGWGSVGRTTRSTPLESRSTTWCPGGRTRRNWGEASATASQDSMLRGLPCAVQPKQEASTQSHDVADPGQPIFEPKTVPGFMSGAQASGVAIQPYHSPHDIEPSQEPHPLWGSGSVVLHPTPSPEIHGGEGAGNRLMQNYKRWKEELNIDSLPCRANDYGNAFYNQFCRVESITTEIATRERPAQLGIRPKVHERQSVNQETTLDHDHVIHETDSSGISDLQINQSKAQLNPNMSRATSGVSLSPKPVEQLSAVPEIVLANEVSSSTGGETSLPGSNEQPTATPKITTSTNTPKIAAGRICPTSDEKPRVIGIPEWEIQRCFNCFHEGHLHRDCYNPRLGIHEREQLRDEQGVINRRWTVDLLTYHSHLFTAAVVTKHRGFSRIWEPYTAATGQTVTPSATFPFQQVADVGIQTENNETSSIGVQTDAGHTQGTMTDRPTQKIKNRRKKALANKAEASQVEANYSEVQKVEVSKAVVNHSEANKSEAGKAEAGKTDANNASVKKREVEKPEANKSEARKAEVGKTDANNAAVKKREVKKPEVNKPEAGKSEAGKPDASNAAVKKREVKKPEVNKSEASKAEVGKTDANNAAVKKPEMKRSEGKKPEVNKARVKKAEVNKVDENKMEPTETTPEKPRDKCWLCKDRHLEAECKATSPHREPVKLEDNSWVFNMDGLPALPKKHALGRQISPKEIKPKKTLKNPSLIKSGIISSETALYKIERIDSDGFQEFGDNDVSYEETVLDRGDLRLLETLDKDANRCKSKNKVFGSGKPNSSGSATVQSSHLCRCPNEILESIFTYAADGDTYGETKKVRDMVTGTKWDIDEGVNDTSRKARNLTGVAKSCQQLRLVAQCVIYRVVCIKTYAPLYKLARTLTADPHLGGMVQVLKIHLKQECNYKNRGVYRHEKVNNVALTSTNSASVLVRIVESCRNLQLLSTKLHGSVLGFSTLQGKFRQLREVVISDESSRGQVMNYMWNHLTNFPRLNKFKVIHSDMNSAMDFTPLEIPFFMAERGLDSGSRTLSNLQLENAPEVSDALLFLLVRRFYVLTKLAIVNCKLVTSAGIARALAEMPDRLSHLIFWVWHDRSGHVSPREALPSDHHLCEALRVYGKSLVTINLKPHKVCEDLWNEAQFGFLQRIVIDMGQFSHCRKEVATRGDSEKHESPFKEAYKAACTAGRLPRMEESRAMIKLHTNGISYH